MSAVRRSSVWRWALALLLLALLAWLVGRLAANRTPRPEIGIGAVEGRSDAEREGVGRAVRMLVAQRLDGARLVEPHPLVELRRQVGLEVVALQLGLRPVDDPNGA